MEDNNISIPGFKYEDKYISIPELKYEALIKSDTQISMIANALRSVTFDGDFRKFCSIIIGVTEKEEAPDA